MKTRFKVIAIPTQFHQYSSDINPELYTNCVKEFVKHFSYDIDNHSNVHCFLKHDQDSEYFTSLDEAKKSLNQDKFQIIVSYDSSSLEVTAFHENYFATKVNGDFHVIDTQEITIDKVPAKLNVDELNRSFVHAYLTELAFSNAGLVDIFQRGIGHGDYLYEHRNEVLYPIQMKPKSHAVNSPLEPNGTVFPVIDLDNINETQVRYALENFGSFEIIGSVIKDLSESTAPPAMQAARELFKLPEAELEQCIQQNRDFYGYQPVRKETIAAHAKNPKVQIKNNNAYHFKPYKREALEAAKLPSRVPAGFDVTPCELYYKKVHAIAHTLFRKLAWMFNVDPALLINYAEDLISALTSRIYYDAKDGETGIDEHSDYGILTFIIADKPGLEIQRAQDRAWMLAPFGPGYRVIVNVGDWFEFMLKNIKSVAGFHRVEKVTERHMFAFFLNADRHQKQDTPLKKNVPYIEYLMSDKTNYNDDPRFKKKM